MVRVHSSLLQLVQIEPEVTPGTALPATKRLPSLNIAVNPDGKFNRYRPRGYKVATIVVPGTEMASLKIDGPGSYGELVYPFASLCGKVTPSSVGTSARQWTFLPNYAGADDTQTFSVEQGDNFSAIKAAYAIVNEMGMEFTRDQVTVSGAGFANSLGVTGALGKNTRYQVVVANTSGTTTFTLTFQSQTTVATLTLGTATAATVQTALELLSTIGAGNVLVTRTASSSTSQTFLVEMVGTLGQTSFPLSDLTGAVSGGTGGSITITRPQTGAAATTIENIPILPTQWYISMADTLAGHDSTTVLAQVTKASWKIGNKYGQFWSANSDTTLGETGYNGFVEVEPSTEFMMTIGWGTAQAKALYTTVRAGDTKMIRIVARGALIETGYYYLFQADLAVKINKVADHSDDNGLYAVSWTAEMVPDLSGSGLAGFARFIFVNQISAL
jgi:hypothetical protein